MALTDRRFFGLLGEVVDHNPTEEMMQAAFDSAGLQWKYVSIPCPHGSFAEFFRASRRLGFSGLHITKPYKVLAAKLVDKLTIEAARIGAVNCVYLEGGTLVGGNTDGRGLVDAVGGLRPVSGSKVVVLGAGGAGRAVAVELALGGAQDVVIVNRSPTAGKSLVRAVRSAADVDCHYEEWSAPLVLDSAVDLVVNATSIGMLDPVERPSIDLTRLGRAAVVADVVIAPRATGLLHEASQLGLRTVSGAEMLVKQAARSFELWSGTQANELVLRQALEAALRADAA